MGLHLGGENDLHRGGVLMKPHLIEINETLGGVTSIAQSLAMRLSQPGEISVPERNHAVTELGRILMILSDARESIEILTYPPPPGEAPVVAFISLQ